MAGRESATARVTVLIVALLVAGAGLHGYLPPAALSAHREDPDSPAWLILLAAVLVLALAIITVAVINRLREHRAVAAGFAPLTAGAGAGAARPTWRVLAIGLAVIAAWLVLNATALRLLAAHRVEGLLLPGDVPVQTTGGGPNPTEGAGPGGGPAPHPGAAELDSLTRAALALLALAGLGIAVAVHRRRPGQQAREHLGAGAGGGAPDAGPAALARAAELGLAAIGDPNAEPRQAIIACYAAMEHRLQAVPGAAPQDCDTPTEVLTRALQRRVLAAEHADGLVALFGEARFSAHPMTERHRDDAVRILAVVLADLQGAA